MKHFDQIESYVNGSMTIDDSRTFEHQLSDDEELRKELEDYRIARHASGVLAYQDAKQRISQLRQSPMQVVHRRNPGRQLLRIAAVIVVFVITSFLFSQIRFSNSALAGRNYDSIAMNMRSPGTDGVAGLIDSKKYEEALALLQESNATDPLSKGLMAEALTKLERYPEAITIYQELAVDPENVNREGAEFALALLNLQIGNDTEANAQIAMIAASETHDFRFEARELQKQLKSVWRKLVL